MPRPLTPQSRLRSTISGEIKIAACQEDRLPQIPRLDERNLAEEAPTEPMCEITSEIRTLPERRIEGREEVARQVHFSSLSTNESLTNIGRVSDLSQAGMFICTPRTMRPGHRINGKVRADVLGKRQPLTFEGEVVWSTYTSPFAAQGPGFGVKFTKLDPFGSELIKEIVRQR